MASVIAAFAAGYLASVFTFPWIARRLYRWAQGRQLRASIQRFRAALAQAEETRKAQLQQEARSDEGGPCGCVSCQMVRHVTKSLADQGQLIRRPWERDAEEPSA